MPGGRGGVLLYCAERPVAADGGGAFRGVWIMAETQIEAEPRVALGKKVKALRRAGVTPIHVYGRSAESLSLQAETHALARALGAVGQTSPLTVKADGQEHFVMAQHVQRHPVTERLLHVDFIRVSRTERVQAVVPLRFEGESLGARADGASLSEDLREITVEALPTDIPQALAVDLSALETPDSAILAGDLPLPAGVTLITDPAAYVARVTQRGAAAEPSVESDAETPGEPEGGSAVGEGE